MEDRGYKCAICRAEDACTCDKDGFIIFLEAELQRLRIFLSYFGRHDESCTANKAGGLCDCGLTAARQRRDYVREYLGGSQVVYSQIGNPDEWSSNCKEVLDDS